MSRVREALALAALVAGLVSLIAALDSNHVEHRGAFAVLNLLIGWSFVGSGLLAWSRRPENRVGVLMAATGLVWLLGGFQLANDSGLYTLGIATSSLSLAVFVHLVLAFPEGRLGSRAARLATLAGYLDATAAQLAALLLFEPAAPRFDCPECPANALLVSRNDAVTDAIFTGQNALAVVIAAAVIAILARRWRGATAPARRALAPVLWSGAITAVLGVFLFVSILAAPSLADPARLATFSVLATVPLAFLAGLLHSRLARTAVSRLVVELSTATAPGRLREAIARALGDPSLGVAYWLPETGSYVDAGGRPVALPAPGSSRAATLVEREGRRIGALVHDVTLTDQPELVDAVCAAAGLALENERLQAELRARLEELQASEARLRSVIEAAPVAIVEVGLDGRVGMWNKAAEAIFGWRSSEALGGPLPFVPEEKEKEVRQLIERTQHGQPFHDVVSVRRRKDGSLVDVSLSGAPVRTASGEIVGSMAVLADITQRLRAEHELRRERDFISSLVDSAPVLVVVFDREGRLLRFNRECERLTGYAFGEVEGRHFWDLFILPDEAGRVRRALERVWTGDFPSANENFWLTRSGERRLILWSNNALLDETGEVEYIVSAGLDITDRKRAEEELRASRARIVEAGDEERRRLERNLHDGAQQRLVSLSLALRLAQSRVKLDPEAAVRLLVEASEELARTLTELRELARGIHPAILTDRGLPAALEALAGRATTPVELEIALDERLPPPLEAAVYYVVSEAVVNVAKHADADTVTVSVGCGDGRVVVEVSDDGAGGADPSRGSGLRGLADRVDALDGRLEVASPPGQGTRVRAEIPLPVR